MANSKSLESDSIVFWAVLLIAEQEEEPPYTISVERIQLEIDFQESIDHEYRTQQRKSPVDATIQAAIERLIAGGVFRVIFKAHDEWLIQITDRASTYFSDYPISTSTVYRQCRDLKEKDGLITKDGTLDFKKLDGELPKFKDILLRITTHQLNLKNMEWPDGEITSVREYLAAIMSLKRAGNCWKCIPESNRMINLQPFRDQNRKAGLSLSDEQMYACVVKLLATQNVGKTLRQA